MECCIFSEKIYLLPRSFIAINAEEPEKIETVSKRRVPSPANSFVCYFSVILMEIWGAALALKGFK